MGFFSKVPTFINSYGIAPSSVSRWCRFLHNFNCVPTPGTARPVCASPTPPPSSSRNHAGHSGAAFGSSFITTKRREKASQQAEGRLSHSGCHGGAGYNFIPCVALMQLSTSTLPAGLMPTLLKRTLRDWSGYRESQNSPRVGKLPALVSSVCLVYHKD